MAPYIPEESRKDFLRAHHWPQPITPAELAYIVATLCGRWFERQEDKGWSTRMDVLKALDSVADEWRRRVVRPHEDAKRRENGSIF